MELSLSTSLPSRGTMAAQSGSIRPHRQQWCQTVGILVMMLFVGYDLYLNATADFDATSTPYVTLVSQILSIMLVLVLFLMLAIETHPCKVGLVKVRHRVRTLRSCAPLSLSLPPPHPPPLPSYHNHQRRRRLLGVLAIHACGNGVDGGLPCNNSGGDGVANGQCMAATRRRQQADDAG